MADTYPISAGTTADLYQRLVEDLGVEHRSKDALRQLMFARSLATRAVRRGLRHTNPAVRIGCCKVLDHHMDAAAIPEHDPEPIVRKIARWCTPGGTIYRRRLPTPEAARAS